MSQVTVLTAGGTGGHVFPAIAVAEELIKQNQSIHFIADQRTEHLIPATFPKTILNIVPPSAGKSKQIRALAAASKQCLKLYKELKPTSVACFGGYPSLPAGLAATAKRIPFIVHEQNAVMGRTNWMLAPFARSVALSYEQTLLKPKRCAVFTGNPVRSDIQPVPYPEYNGQLNILVTGGSLGASIFSTVIPDTFKAMTAAQRKQFNVIQQCRNEDRELVEKVYNEIDMNVELAPFFDNLPEKIAESHLVICRAGASTIAELCAIGRPAVFVPYPYAAHNHQMLNAQAIEGATVVKQTEFDVKFLLNVLSKENLYNDLKNKSIDIKKFYKPNAAVDITNLLNTIHHKKHA